MASTSTPSQPKERALLLLPLPSLSHISHPSHLSPILDIISRRPLSRLLIVFLSPLFLSHHLGGLNVRQHWHVLQRLLGVVYVEAMREALDRGEWDRRVEVLLEGAWTEELEHRVGKEWDKVYSCDRALPPSSSLSQIPHKHIPPPHLPPEQNHTVPSHPPAAYHPSTHRITALGGTFDHLHAGHLILLSSALLLTSSKLIVGLTAPALLKNKRHAHLVQSMAERTKAVEEFCKLFRPGVQVESVGIEDVAGPTAWDAAIEALVVSRETVSGAEAIAKIRETNRLPPLEVYVIDVVSPSEAALGHEDAERLKEAKISSTAIRGWLAERGATAP